MSGGSERRRLSFSDLREQVLDRNLCTGCGACYTVCPVEALDFNLETLRPELRGGCIDCGLCYRVCPMTVEDWFTLETAVFNLDKPPSSPYGFYTSIYEARSLKPEILAVAQDGGAVTSLLGYALESNFVDAVLATKPSKDNPLKAEPAVASNLEELLRCAGSRYTPAPVLSMLREADRRGFRRLGYVSIPHGIVAARRLSRYRIRGVEAKITLTVGLFCFETFPPSLLRDALSKTLGKPAESIARINIKRGRFVVKLSSGGEVRVRIRDVPVEPCGCCPLCKDFTARLADVSVGSLGLEGWNVVVVRTGLADKLVREAVDEGWLQIREPSSSTLANLEKFSKLKISKGKR